MAIEIKELIIKASVGAGGAGAGGGEQAGSTSNNNLSPTEELVNTCVEKILEILKEKHER
jgi:hypothetical protein